MSREVDPSPPLHDTDVDILADNDIAETMVHVRRLQGLSPYSMQQVLPKVSVSYFYRLLKVVRKLRECQSMQTFRELDAENRELRRELRRLWKLERVYREMCQQKALDFGGGGSR